MAEKLILLSVGDDSGDLHAANLMAALRRLEPEVRFVGLGMERMRRAGLEPLGDEARGGSRMWFRNLLRLGAYRRRLDACCECLDERRPDLVLPVDFGGFFRR